MRRAVGGIRLRRCGRCHGVLQGVYGHGAEFPLALLPSGAVPAPGRHAALPAPPRSLGYVAAGQMVGASFPAGCRVTKVMVVPRACAAMGCGVLPAAVVPWLRGTRWSCLGSSVLGRSGTRSPSSCACTCRPGCRGLPCGAIAIAVGSGGPHCRPPLRHEAGGHIAPFAGVLHCARGGVWRPTVTEDDVRYGAVPDGDILVPSEHPSTPDHYGEL